MTKLQTLVAEIQLLPVEEQRELALIVAHLAAPEEDIFELTEAELAEIDDRIKNDTVTYTHKEAMDWLREKYATDIGTK